MMSEAKQIPTFLTLGIDITDWPCLIVGGGTVATHKARLLEQYGGRVTVCAPDVTPELEKTAGRGAIRLNRREFTDESLQGMRLVVAATNSSELNARIVALATARSLLALNVSDAAATPILFPAILNGADRLTIAIHTHGADPARSAAMRSLLAGLLTESTDISDHPDHDESTPSFARPSSIDSPTVGHVTLIGAGPGAPDLIPLRGLRRLRAAEVIIMDGLLSPTFLSELGVASEKKRVIWLGEGHRRNQDEINALLLEAASAGKRVARLKTGDPFVFGRAAEEIGFLEEHGIPWDVIPGVTSALAAPASAGVLLTRRGSSRSFAVMSGRCEGGGGPTCFPRADHLVVLMAVSSLAEIVTRLREDGWPAATPALLVERASLPWERRLAASLETIVAQASDAAIHAPAVLIVGRDATTRFTGRRRILFTGLDPELFRPLGDLIHWPALARVPLPEADARLREAMAAQEQAPHDLILFAGKGAADRFFTALEVAERDLRILAGSTIHAIGGGTAERLMEHGINAATGEPDFQAPAEPRLLLIEETHTSADLLAKIEAARVRMTRIRLNRLVPNPLLGKPLPEHDAVLFVSPAGERAFRAAYPAYDGLVLAMNGKTR